MTAQELIDALSALTAEQKRLQLTATYDCGKGRAGVDGMHIEDDQIYLCEYGYGNKLEVPR